MSRRNDGCALERYIEGDWLPAAIRTQRLTRAQRRELDRGKTITVAGALTRRVDWAERQALHYVLCKEQ